MEESPQEGQDQSRSCLDKEVNRILTLGSDVPDFLAVLLTLFLNWG